MLRFATRLLLFTALALAVPSGHRAPEYGQQVLKSEPSSNAGNPRKLRGRILHITDLHPDPFYKVGADADGDHPCHKGSSKTGVDHFGAPTTGCDSPFTLINATFRWIEENIKDEIDFVIWTGDSARHDNDESFPRSVRMIENLNEFAVSKFVQTFGKSDNVNDPDPTNDFVVPIVPTFGNNDVLPHNIFEPGPNRWTKKYIKIWQSFVPEEQKHSFARGGWFFSEVIPNKLAVFSLNTLYFFASNAAVDGCDLKSEPGYEQMDWLRIQLEFLRQRQMKAILTGHVPPARTESKQAWDESCYQKYTLWLRQYRDVIVGNVFGHMNIDHFMFQDVKDLRYRFNVGGVEDERAAVDLYESRPIPNNEFHAAAKADYLNELRDGWALLPKPPKGTHYSPDELHDDVVTETSKKHGNKKKFLKEIGGQWGERFSLSLVSPSVVPNFFPTLRIIEYNISGLERDHPAIGAPVGTPAEHSDIMSEQPEVSDLAIAGGSGSDVGASILDLYPEKKKKKKHKNRKKKKKKKKHPKKFPVPKPPSSTSPPGPAYSSQTFTFLSWTQLYANLTKIQQKIDTKSGADQINVNPDPYELEKDPEWLAAARERHRSKKQKKSHDDKNYKYFDFKVEYTTNNDKVYNMRDLTMRSWLDLAERIGRTELKGDAVSVGLEDFNEGGDGTKPRIQLNRTARVGLEKSNRPRLGKLKKNHLWHAFIKRAFVHTRADEDLEGDFD